MYQCSAMLPSCTAESRSVLWEHMLSHGVISLLPPSRQGKPEIICDSGHIFRELHFAAAIPVSPSPALRFPGVDGGPMLPSRCKPHLPQGCLIHTLLILPLISLVGNRACTLCPHSPQGDTRAGLGKQSTGPRQHHI